MGGILAETKVSLGLDPETDSGFEGELVLFINSVLSEFNQLGIGPDDGFEIFADADGAWSDFLGNDPRYNMARSLLHLKVKMMFDPPSLGYLITAYEKMIEKYEWRLNVMRETIVHPIEDDEDVPEEELLILDGGEI